MNEVTNLLDKKGNIAIIGVAGSGKTYALKSILGKVVKSNKKVLVLNDCKGEYEDVTNALEGKYYNYDERSSISYNNKLTTVFSYGYEVEVKNIGLEIIKTAVENGVEIILIDDAHYYLENCNELSEYDVQFIVGTQNCLDEGNLEQDFKGLFKTLIVMPSRQYKTCGVYNKLLNLFDIADVEMAEKIIDSRERKRGDGIVLEDKKISFSINV